MTTPTTWGAYSSAVLTGTSQVDSLLYGTEWSMSSVTYSFAAASSYWSTSIAGYGPSTSTSGEPWSTSYLLTSGEMAAVRTALASWAAVASISFLEVTDSSTVAGDIRFGYANGNLTGANGQAWAYAPGAFVKGGDVWFNTQSSSLLSTWSAGSYEYQTVIHELGHAIGLKHPFDASPTNTTLIDPSWDSRSFTVMSYKAGVGLDNSYFSFEPTTPMVLDILAAQHLYGANSSFNSTDTTYTFGAGTYHQAIWDGGGTDWIVNSASLASEIDLRPGYGSTLGQPVYVENAGGTPLYSVHNVWIAYGVTIENARGGSGADEITGNDAPNILDGGAGADTMVGGAGADTYYVDNTGDEVDEGSQAGTDLIYSSVSFSLPANVENLTLTGSSSLSEIGNGVANALLANSGDNRITGGGGDDSIDGAGGTDTAVFASSLSQYTVLWSQTNQTFTITSTTEGSDTVKNVEFFEFAGVSYSAAALIDFTPPSIVGLTPTDGAVGVAIGSDVVLTFSEAVARGTGNIVLKTSSGLTVETFDSASSQKLTLSGSTLSINPTADLAYSTTYKLDFPAGAVTDLAGNSFGGTAPYTYDFVTAAAPPDTTAPLAVTFSPADGTTGIAVGSDIVITFNEAIAKGSGNLLLKTATGLVVETFDAASSDRLTFSGNSLTINPSADLAYGTSFSLELPPSTVKDLAGNSYGGIATYDFATGAPPTPAAPSILSVLDDIGTAVGVVSPGALTDDAELLVSGRSSANETVTVYDGSLQVGRTTANNTGAWALTTAPLTSATHTFTAKASNSSNVEGPASGAYAVTVSLAIAGTSGSDALSGTKYANTMAGLAGDDVLYGGAGNDSLDGGSGLDVARYDGQRAGYVVTNNGTNMTVEAISGSEGTDVLTSIERIAFQDKAVAFDLTGAAGMTVRLLGAIFGSGYAGNAEFVGTGLALYALKIFGSAATDREIANVAISSPLFAQMAGPSNADFVNTIYHNVIGSYPSQPDLLYYTSLLDTGATTRADLAVMASQTTYNEANVGLVGLSQSGVEYVPAHL
jgi:methionine-rich copper-binding protein CopC